MPLRPRRPLTRPNPLDSVLLEPKRQCTAHSKRTGERCKNLAMTAQRTCRMHGGATRKARVSAAKRIAEATGYAADMLVEFMADPKVDVKLRTQIAQDLLQRAGISGKTELVVEMPEWQKAMEAAAKPGSVSINWGEFLPQPLAIEAAKPQPATRPGRPSRGEVIVAEIVEDDEPRGVDARSEADHRAARRAALDASRKSHPTPRRRPNNTDHA